MASQRDSQRIKVYRAEEALPGRWRNQFGTNEQAQEFVDSITNDRWFKARWKLPYSRVSVAVGRGHNGFSYGGRITLSPSGRNPIVALHELTHEVLGAAAHGWQPHGAEFCGTFLFLVGHYIGKEQADRLRDDYVKHAVKHRPASGVVPRQPRFTVPTQEQERTAKARLLNAPPRPADVRTTVTTLRWMVKQGVFGDSGSKGRKYVLDVIRKVERTGHVEVGQLIAAANGEPPASARK